MIICMLGNVKREKRIDDTFLKAHYELSQTSKMELFQKQSMAKKFHLTYLTVL